MSKGNIVGCWLFSDEAPFCWSLMDKETKTLHITSAYEISYQNVLIAMRKYVGKIPEYRVIVNRIDMTHVFRKLERSLQTYRDEFRTIEVFPWRKNTFFVISSTHCKFPLYPFVGDIIGKKELEERGFKRCTKS